MIASLTKLVDVIGDLYPHPIAPYIKFSIVIIILILGIVLLFIGVKCYIKETSVTMKVVTPEHGDKTKTAKTLITKSK